MRSWMKAEHVDVIPNLDQVVLRLLAETDRLAQQLPSFGGVIHEDCTCLEIVSDNIKLACGDGQWARLEVGKAMRDAIHGAAMHVVGLAKVPPEETTWAVVAECGVWHSLMGCSTALLCAAGYGMFVGPPMGPDGTGFDYNGKAGVLVSMLSAVTYTSMLRHMVDKPHLTYASSSMPPRAVRADQFPGYVPMWMDRPQWLAAILDEGIPEGRALPSDLFFAPPSEEGVANR